jgi:RES domain-containing protein
VAAAVVGDYPNRVRCLLGLVTPETAGGWPCPKTNAAVGDNWARSGRTAVLKLPSAVVPAEFNYILNPAHPDFARISIGKPRVFKADTRLGPLASP